MRNGLEETGPGELSAKQSERIQAELAWLGANNDEVDLDSLGERLRHVTTLEGLVREALNGGIPPENPTIREASRVLTNHQVELGDFWRNLEGRLDELRRRITRDGVNPLEDNWVADGIPVGGPTEKSPLVCVC